MSTRLAMELSSICAMLLVLYLAWRNGTFLPSQKPGEVWLPVIANGAIWGNLFLLSIFFFVVGKYSGEWSGWQIVLSQNLGMLASCYMWFYIYPTGKYADGLAKPLSFPGLLTMVYGGFVFATILLFYLCSRPTTADVLVVWALFAVYIPVANHAPLEFIASGSSNLSSWCPDIFASEARPLRIILGGEALALLVTGVKLFSLYL